ncbi:MAG: DUF1559 domain-containing protein [Planctomycetes bacterium]|nr:DUF1559 domain-containing protein [Planctomycetota bacterium]
MSQTPQNEPSLAGSGLANIDVSKLQASRKATQKKSGNKNLLLMLGIVAAIGVVLFAISLPLLLQLQRDARLKTDESRLKLVGLAIANYEATNKSLPFPVATNAQGEKVWSWRIALLPYLYTDADRNLHKEVDFKDMQPWNSPKNAVLQKAAPAIFQSSRFRHPSGSKLSNVFLIVAPKREGVIPVFVDGRQTKVRELTDGPADTIMAIMLAKHSSEWANPANLSVDEAYAYIQKEDEKVLCLYGDFSTGRLPVNIDRQTFDAIVTPRGGESVRAPK